LPVNNEYKANGVVVACTYIVSGDDREKWFHLRHVPHVANHFWGYPVLTHLWQGLTHKPWNGCRVKI